MATSRPWASGVLRLGVSLGVSLGLAPSEPPSVRAVVLGIAQDGGVPHIGCRQDLCVAARRDPARRQRVASLGLVDGDARFLIDATPDLPSQIESLWGRRRRPTAGGRCPASCSRTRTSATTRASCPSAARRSGPTTSPSTRRPAWRASCARTRPGASSSRAGTSSCASWCPAASSPHAAAARHARARSAPRRALRHGRLRRARARPAAALRARHRQVAALGPPARRRGRARSTWRSSTARSSTPRRSRDAARRTSRIRWSARRRRCCRTALRARVRLIHLNHTNRLLWAPEALAAPALRGLTVARDGDRLPAVRPLRDRLRALSAPGAPRPRRPAGSTESRSRR